MQLSLSRDLTPLKNDAINKIDQQAEIVRSQYITLGSGQAMVYAQKEKEAEMVSQNPSISPALVPHIASEAAMAGISLLDQAAIVLSMANYWRDVSAVIETKRLAHKELVRAATNPAEITAAENITWS